MKSIIQLLKNAENTRIRKNWDTIYWAIDLHDTIIESDYKDWNVNEVKFYPYALSFLEMISNRPENKLILFTSCSWETGNRIMSDLRKKNVKFHYFNENPEVKNTVTGYFNDKFYYNIVLDDKAGFDPNEDWEMLYLYYKENR